MPHDVKRKSVASIGNGLHGPNLMPELDHLLNALFFVALLLYLIPAAFGLGNSPKHQRQFQLAAIVTLGTAIAIAVVASVIWLTR